MEIPPPNTLRFHGYRGGVSRANSADCSRCPIFDGLFGGGISDGGQTGSAPWTKSVCEFHEASAQLVAAIRSGGGGISSFEEIPPHVAEELRSKTIAWHTNLTQRLTSISGDL